MCEKSSPTFFRPLMLLALLAGTFSLFIQRNSDLNDFSKGIFAGIWIGLFVLAVVRQSRGSKF